MHQVSTVQWVCKLTENKLYCSSPASKSLSKLSHAPSILNHTVSLYCSVTDSSQPTLGRALVAIIQALDLDACPSVGSCCSYSSTRSRRMSLCQRQRQCLGDAKKVQKLSALSLICCQKQKLHMSVCNDHRVPLSTLALVAQAAL